MSRSDDAMVAVGFNPRFADRAQKFSSRSDDAMVAVGFNPRFADRARSFRRVATVRW